MKESKENKEYSGGCLCKDITFVSKGEPSFPHLCSCHMCQKWSGAPTVAWVDFPSKSFNWNGPGGKPTLYRSSENTQRCFCSRCGGTLGAIDDGSETIGITIASLDDPDSIVPGKQHSFKESAPSWWQVNVVHPYKKKDESEHLSSQDDQSLSLQSEHMPHSVEPTVKEGGRAEDEQEEQKPEKQKKDEGEYSSKKEDQPSLSQNLYGFHNELAKQSGLDESELEGRKSKKQKTGESEYSTEGDGQVSSAIK